jgi:hypothetical protein
MSDSRAKPKAKGLSRAIKTGPTRSPGDPATVSRISFSATLFRPVATAKPFGWLFLSLPEQASSQLPSRGLNSVEGTLNGLGFQATLEPDGQGSHWLKVGQPLRDLAGVSPGDVVSVEIAPVTVEPEPLVPDDLKSALTAAIPKAREVWSDITPIARRDWIQWIDSAKREATRLKRIESTCDMLAKGKRRPCCFDRSGIYAKNLSKPVAEETPFIKTVKLN